MRLQKRLLASAALLAMTALAPSAFAYETTTFSVSLGDASKTGTFAIDQSTIGNGTNSITNTVANHTYNYAYQYFTPGTTGTYVFGQLASPADTVIILYSPTYSSAHPGTNFITMNDDGNANSVADAALRSYVQTQIASRSCGGSPGLCPLLTSTLTSGVDYYVVVSTYSPGASLGTPSDSVAFFVIGDAQVGVGGAPPPSSTQHYVSVTSSSPASHLANYLDTHDDSGAFATIAAYLDTLPEHAVAGALKTIFPVNTSVAPQTMSSANGQTATVLIDKVGTVLGSINTPNHSSLAEGSFDTSKWLFGENSAAPAPVSLDFSGQENDPSSARMDGTLASLASLPYKKYEANGRAFWVQGVGALTHGDAQTQSLGYNVNSLGVVSGYEFTLDQNNLAGVIASAFRSNVDIDSSAGQTDASTYSLGLYGQHLLGSVKLTGIVLGSLSRYDSERFVNIGGISGRPQSDYNGWGTSTTINVSKLFDQDGLKIEPFLNVNYSTTSTDGYTETGGGVYNMTVSSDSSSTASAKTGVTVQHETDLSGYALELKAKPYIGYTREISSAGNTVSLSGAANSVVINGRDINSAQVGLGLEAKLDLNKTSSAKLGLDLSHDRNEDTGVAYVGYGLKF